MSTYRYVKKNTLFLFVNVLTQLLKLLSFIRYEQPTKFSWQAYPYKQKAWQSQIPNTIEDHVTHATQQQGHSIRSVLMKGKFGM